MSVTYPLTVTTPSLAMLLPVLSLQTILLQNSPHVTVLCPLAPNPIGIKNLAPA